MHVAPLTGKTDGPVIEPRNQKYGLPMPLSEAEGTFDLAQSEILYTSESPSHRNVDTHGV